MSRSGPMRWLLAVAAAPALLMLAGCTPTVSLDPAPHATSVGCAGVVARLPQTVGNQRKRQTDAQGAAAWGTPASVTLRCGLTPVVVSSQDCYPVDGVNWLRVDQKIAGAERVVLTTYGRVPAVQVVVDPGRVSASDVLPPIADAISAATKATELRCVAPGDATPAPSATPDAPLATHGPPASE